MNTTTRHWHILRLIPRHPNRTDVGRIHRQLEEIEPALQVTRRTLERDLNLLSDSFPLERDGCRPQGWWWRKDAEGLDVPGMDLTAALTFRMAEEYLSRLLPHSCLQSLAPHMKRARTLLEELSTEGLAAWPQKVRVVSRNQPLLPPTVGADVVEVVYKALLSNRRFTGTYRPQGGEGKLYEINPLGLVISDPVIYLVATCWDYTDIRLLALHRFSGAELREKPVIRPEGFDLQRYIDGGALGFCDQFGKSFRLRALFTRGAAAHLRESRLSEGQVVKDRKDGRVLIEAQVADTAQLRWWLLGFGAQVEVLGPKALREEIAETVRKMGEVYA